MSLSSISPLGNLNSYPAIRAEKAPVDLSVPDPGKAAYDVFEKRTVNGDKPSDDAAFETYTGIPPLDGAEKPASLMGEDKDQSESSEEAKGEDSKASDRAGDARDTGESNHTAAELKQIDELKLRDREVKAHEQAHIAAGGQYVRGGAHFEYQTGPDGERYAVGGDVSIDVSKESDDPQATIAKMRTVIQAAMAPANPSSQDRAVAAKAARIEMEARAEALAESQSNAETESNTEKTAAPDDNQGSDAYAANPPPAGTRINLYA